MSFDKFARAARQGLCAGTEAADDLITSETASLYDASARLADSPSRLPLGCHPVRATARAIQIRSINYD